jgi:hypothetical protein
LLSDRAGRAGLALAGGARKTAAGIGRVWFRDVFLKRLKCPENSADAGTPGSASGAAAPRARQKSMDRRKPGGVM